MIIHTSDNVYINENITINKSISYISQYRKKTIYMLKDKREVIIYFLVNNKQKVYLSPIDIDYFTLGTDLDDNPCFIAINNNKLYIYNLTDKYKIDFTNENYKILHTSCKILHIYQRDGFWYIIMKNATIDVYCPDFKFIKTIQLFNENIQDAIIIGTIIIFCHKDTIYYYDIVLKNIILKHSFDNIIDGFTFYDNELYLIMDGKVTIYNKDLTYNQELNYNFKIKSIYINYNDYKFNLSWLNYPYVKNIPFIIFNNLIEVKHSEPHNISSIYINDIYPSINNIEKENTNYKLDTESLFIIGITNLSLEQSGKLWEISNYKCSKYIKDIFRNVYEYVRIDNIFESFFLYIHPESGLIHAVPDHNEYIKFYTIIKDKEFYNASVTFNTKRYSTEYYLTTVNEKLSI